MAPPQIYTLSLHDALPIYLPVNGQAFGVSQDGSIVVGYTYSGPLTIEAFRWTRAEGVVLMGDLPGGEPRNFTYGRDRKSTRLNSSHQIISYAVFCLKKKTT